MRTPPGVVRQQVRPGLCNSLALKAVAGATIRASSSLVRRLDALPRAGRHRPPDQPFWGAVTSFEERIYELGAGALAEQERQVAEVRGRGATLLAASAVIASLLATPVFHGDHPHGFAEVTAMAIGLLGSAGVLVFVVLLLRPYELGFSVKPGATYRALWKEEILAQPMVDIALAEAFEERRNGNAQVVQRLVLYLAGTLVALVVETAGLGAAAALAS